MTKADVKSSAWCITFNQQVLQGLKNTLEELKYQILAWQEQKIGRTIVE